MKFDKLLLVVIFSLATFILHAQQSVLTQHNDLNRSGWNNKEKILHTKNVKRGSFGKIFTRTVDDQIYSQPLIVSGVNIPAIGKKNVVYVTTVNNSVYAFDADSSKVTDPYWQINLTPANSRPPKNTDVVGGWCANNYHDIANNMGIISTPVIDTVSQTIYLVSRDYNNTSSAFEQFVHALDIRTGLEKANSPMKIVASVTGNGDGSAGGTLTFNNATQNQRSGLLLLNGIVYITYASHCDWGPYHGWILGYDQTTLEQKIVYVTTPDGYNGGIWMSGAGPAADDAGNIYVAVGNGSIGKNGNNSDLRNRSESAMKLTPSGSTLAVNTFFTPKNIEDLEAADLDFGVTEVLLIPGTTRAMTGCKDGRIYLLDRDNMGGYSASTNNVIQTIDLGNNAHLRSSLGYYKGEQKEFVYSWSENALLKAFPYSRTTNMFDLNSTISSGVQGPIGNNGALLAVSSNGSIDSTAILWTSHSANGDANQSTRPGILRAFLANDVTKEIWNSSQVAGDSPGNYAKFNCPTIVNGKVYLATFSNKLVVYGLTGGKAFDQCGSTNLGLNKTVVATSIEGNNTPASAAFDGDLTTRWSSLYTDPQSIYVDLGATYELCSVDLKWETALGKDFKIQVSDDASNWTTVATITGNIDPENYIAINGSGRYVQMIGTARGTQYGYSLWEFEVYGKQGSGSCADPINLAANNIYEDNATLQWSATGATTYNVQYKTVSAGSWTTTTSNTNSIKLTGLACATDYLFQIQGICDQTHSSNYSSAAAFSTLSCDANCSPLPTRWTTLDIGDVGVAGSACYKDGVFELKGSGADIWDTQDGFRFSYKTLVGDGEILARVATMDQSDAWNKCGIMFRESLTPGSRHAFIALTSGNGITFQNRVVTDDITNDEIAVGGLQAPYWIKLVKSGSTYAAYRSADGISWTTAGNTIDAGFGVGIPVYAGLALTSHNNTVLSTATVDNYLFSGVLDIELQSFTASLTLNKKVALQWVTTLENDIKSFVVERSSDNFHYADLDTLAAVNGGKFMQTYNYEDENPLLTMAYYRLRIIDTEGLTSYSAPVSVSFVTSVISDIKSLAPQIYPNPVKGGIVHIKRGDERVRSISMYDATGRTLIQINNVTSETTDIPVHAFANGFYLMEIRTNKNVYKEKVLIKN
jgi:hypothetical protein